jgi:protein-tyrosine-phosphatase/DNA-binding transcriptional ArsR family regulator
VTVGAEPSPLELLQLLADPLRWQLLDELGRSDRRVGELCELVDRPQSLVSYHLRALRNGGLVTARRSAADGRDTYYRGDVSRWADVLRAAGGALHPAIDLERHDRPPPARRRGRAATRILFLCTGNSSRSQMAEALLTTMTDGAVVARSAGSAPKPLHPSAVRVMSDRGIDIAGCRSKHLDRFANERFDRVITLCDKVREVCPEFPGQPTTAHWSMADPATDDAGDLAFIRTADEIDQRVQLLIAQLRAETRDERKHS